MTIEMSTRNTTLYSTKRVDGEVYETFDYEKAQQMVTFTQAGEFAAECMDCKAVIPVALVHATVIWLGERKIPNACPQTTSNVMTGHRVLRDEHDAYDAYEAQKKANA